MRWAILCLLSVSLFAQTVPPQFQNLHTDANDYTCTGTVPCATWPMPLLPEPGKAFADPNFGTNTWRLAAPLTGDQAMSTYSRVQAWNSDNTKMFLIDGQGYATLYDATTTPPTFINRITSDVGYVLPASLDVLWAFTDPKRIYYVPNPSSGRGLELRYLDISLCTAQNCALTSVLVHTFACVSDAIGSDVVAGTPGNQIETGSGAQGGMFDKTDRYFSFTCDKYDGSGRHEIDFVRYDRQTDTVTYQDKWYKVCPGQIPSGCAVWKTYKRNLLRMNQHPDQRFITVIWQCGSRDSGWSRGCGTELYDPGYNYLGVVSPANTHQDVGFDIHGTPVWVGVGAGRNNLADERSISVTDLTAVQPSTLTYKTILLPCSYSRQPTCTGTSLGAKSGSSHISMTGSWGSQPGYGLLSTMILAGQAYANGLAANYPPGTTLGTDVLPGTQEVTPASMSQIAVGVVSTIGTGTAMESVTWTAATASTATATFTKPHAANAVVTCLSCGDTGFAAMENFALQIDATLPDGTAGKFWRIGRTMAIRDNYYNAEPHTAVNRDFTAIVWGSTWNVDPLSNGPVYAFWTRLGTAAPPVGPTFDVVVNNVGNGSADNCRGTYQQGESFKCVLSNPGNLIQISGCGGTRSADGTTYSATVVVSCAVTAQFNWQTPGDVQAAAASRSWVTGVVLLALLLALVLFALWRLRWRRQHQRKP